ncbi:ribbon-helix-helix protein, CopG family [Novosphingobium lentum]|uniref:ribbon-helix-helix protein, CopG family n=1 Tax=Novosphingobium lentum TaxID=145287 RepID=UPI00082E3812|nr:ribbon-helix-helix protein, CopG family [Novosphingobium lentum]
MTRILADLPDEDIQWLDARAAAQGKSRASVLREAVATYKAQSPASGNNDWIERGFGYWANRADIGDGVEYQRAIREDRRPYEDI